jgi:hypothetical protein
MKTHDDKINRAMAEVAGWTDCHRPLAANVHEPITERVLCGIPPGSQIHKPLPNYLADLNAVHEVEMQLRGTDDQHYNDPIIYRRWKEYQHYILESYGVCATARQRCEAILKTLNKWKTEWNS